MTYKIAIVNSSSFGKYFPEQIERLKNIGQVKFFNFDTNIDGKTLAHSLKGFNVIIASVRPFFNKDFFQNKDELLLISRHGIGYNNVDLFAAKEHNTQVTIVPALVERDAVAENAVTNLLALVRQTTQANQAAKNNNWAQRADFLGINITGKTIGIIGCGNIGSRVAEIFKYGFNCQVLVNDPNIDTLWAEKHNIKIVELNELLCHSDIISLNASLNETSYQILNKRHFDKLKKGVYITNTARGELVNEDDLLEALEKEIVKGYATDVMYKEPCYSDHPFINHPQILVTPHTSAYTFECLKGMGDKCVSDVENLVSHKPLENSVSSN